MPQFRVKRTGVVWDVTDPATLKRIKANPQDYEEVKAEHKQKPEKSGY